MANTRKPAAKRTTAAARKTTRPRSASGRFETASESSAPVAVPAVSEEERQGLLQAYTALKSAGLPIPAEISIPVEAWIAEEQQRREIEAAERAKYQQALDVENAAGPWFVRNGYGAEFNLRLDRQTEKRRIQLKPRGNPGDMHPLEDGDLKDPILVRNLNLGLIEVIPAGEANRIMANQTHNMGPRVHTPTALLRNAKGEEYAANAIKTEVEFNRQGVVVATLDPNQMQGHVSDKAVAGTGSFGGLVRAQPGVPERVSEFIPTGGHPATITTAPVGGLGENAQAKIADDLARRKGLSGPAAGLGGLTVTVAPPVKEA